MSAIESGKNSQTQEQQVEVVEKVGYFFTSNEPGDHFLVDPGPEHPGYSIKPPTNIFPGESMPVVNSPVNSNLEPITPVEGGAELR